MITCALSFARMVPLFFVLLGMRAPSTTDHYATKDEVEPVLAAQAERGSQWRSIDGEMASEHEKNVKAG